MIKPATQRVRARRKKNTCSIRSSGSNPLVVLSDEELAIRVAAGDDRAWDVLYARSYEYLWRFSRFFVQDPTDAEDLIQETLVRAWTNRTRYSPSYPYRGWLRTIFRRLATSLHRSEASHGRLIQRASDPVGREFWFGRPPEDGLTAAVRREARDRVAPVLALLSDDDRKILSAWAEGASGIDLAREQDALPSTVRGRLRRAKERFVQEYLRYHGRSRAIP